MKRKFDFWRWATDCLWRGHYWESSWPGITKEELIAPVRYCTECGKKIQFTVYVIRDA